MNGFNKDRHMEVRQTLASMEQMVALKLAVKLTVFVNGTGSSRLLTDWILCR